ncbi:hypothetical protein O1611_g1984 [Lasiodiplodia mahajangana]|uniref:Uncharacterized protein n=1 Tax=Lasiodiplodia mahajangana TaxID=1108764 RepID=A0ACC2JWD0_9PEZI|nr:hypothetical protein O1611_g1984 [Lasiodiplodia mahajangana]
MGVVVAIDNYYGRRVFTIDDSTGQCIECALETPTTTTTAATSMVHRPESSETKTTNPQAVTRAHTTRPKTTDAVSTVPFPADVDVGTVLDIKGTVKLFRGQKQIGIRKATRVLSTNEEVRFWDKIRDFRHDVLSQPWVLKDREVRMWKLQQIEAVEPEAKKRRKIPRGLAEGLAKDPGKSTRNDAESTHVSKGHSRLKNSLGGTSSKVTRAQRTSGTGDLRPKTSDGDKYSALGL